MNWVDWAIWTVAAAPIWGTIGWEIWSGMIRPRLIPAREIDSLADDLLARYGNRAAEIAFIEEDRAWRYSDSFEQGKWRRVRKHLMQRTPDS